MLILVLIRKPSILRNLRLPLIIVVGYLIVALVCLIIAGKKFEHYCLLFVPALALFFGFSVIALKSAFDEQAQGWKRFISGALLWPAAYVFFLFVPIRALRSYVYFIGTENPVHEPSPVASSALGARQIGDTLSVWGWVPSYYVETGIPPATFNAVTFGESEPGILQGYYRKHYLDEIRKSRPAIFIDAVADGAFKHWNENAIVPTHESFPELAKFIDENYVLWSSIRITNVPPSATPVRLYILNERAKQLGFNGAAIPHPKNFKPFFRDIFTTHPIHFIDVSFLSKS